MGTVIYSETVKDKLKTLKDRLIAIQGEKKGIKTIRAIISVLDNLELTCEVLSQSGFGENK